ncbi:hypothetical protein [Halorussus caseinilyticus]|uniref:Cox cluster protein n=1 Tax=Halorussus caseinilyticus TaxID=3034025 RepID=A0ABD5WLM2_9EURY
MASTAEEVSAATTPSVPVGLASGGIFAAVALVIVLVYVDLLDASDIEHEGLRRLLVATILPLLLTFGVIVLYESLSVV